MTTRRATGRKVVLVASVLTAALALAPVLAGASPNQTPQQRPPIHRGHPIHPAGRPPVGHTNRPAAHHAAPRQLHVQTHPLTPLAGPLELSFLSPSVAVNGLVYQGLDHLSVQGTAVDVMVFTADSITASGLTMQLQCSGGHAIRSTIPGGADASMSQPIRFELTGLEFTVNGTLYSFTPLAPPPDGFTLPTATLQGVDLTGIDLSVGSLQATGLQTSVVDC